MQTINIFSFYLCCQLKYEIYSEGTKHDVLYKNRTKSSSCLTYDYIFNILDSHSNQLPFNRAKR
jgi:hypothetical protein